MSMEIEAKRMVKITLVEEEPRWVLQSVGE